MKNFPMRTSRCSRRKNSKTFGCIIRLLTKLSHSMQVMDLWKFPGKFVVIRIPFRSKQKILQNSGGICWRQICRKLAVRLSEFWLLPTLYLTWLLFFQIHREQFWKFGWGEFQNASVMRVHGGIFS